MLNSNSVDLHVNFHCIATYVNVTRRLLKDVISSIITIVKQSEAECLQSKSLASECWTILLTQYDCILKTASLPFKNVIVYCHSCLLDANGSGDHAVLSV